MLTHAANPTVDLIGGNLIRVYFGTRDSRNRSHIGAAVFEMNGIFRLIDLTSSPVIAPGKLGSFDDSGASMGSLVRYSNALYLYYLGWNLGVTVPWRNSIGLAVSEDNGLSFRRYSPAPIMDRSAVDPFSLSYPWVLREGSRWRMWYGSNLSWGSKKHDMMHVIKHAESDDGLNWRRDGRIILPLSGLDEYALTRPCVIHEGGSYRMWFTHRGWTNMIGYAESADGLNWERHEQIASLDVSDDGWDAEMLAYPCIFGLRGTRYMLYNGNEYGKSGFGIAVER
jgi:hypothetical protein